MEGTVRPATLLTATWNPPVGAGLDRPTAQVVAAPDVIELGLHESEDTTVGTSIVIVVVRAAEVPTTADKETVCGVAVEAMTPVNDPLTLPAAITTEVGTGTTAGAEEESFTSTGLAAVAVRRIEQARGLPGKAVVGLQTKLDTELLELLVVCELGRTAIPPLCRVNEPAPPAADEDIALSNTTGNDPETPVGNVAVR